MDLAELGFQRADINELDRINIAYYDAIPKGFQMAKKIMTTIKHMYRRLKRHVQQIPVAILQGVMNVFLLHKMAFLIFAFQLFIGALAPRLVCFLWADLMELLVFSVDLMAKVVQLMFEGLLAVPHGVGHAFLGLCNFHVLVFGHPFRFMCPLAHKLLNLSAPNLFDKDAVTQTLCDARCIPYQGIFYSLQQLFQFVVGGLLHQILYPWGWILQVVGIAIGCGVAYVGGRWIARHSFAYDTAAALLGDSMIQIMLFHKRVHVNRAHWGKKSKPTIFRTPSIRHTMILQRKEWDFDRKVRRVTASVVVLGACIVLSILALLPFLRWILGWMIAEHRPDPLTELCTYVCVGSLMLGLGLCLFIVVMMYDFEKLLHHILHIGVLLAIIVFLYACVGLILIVGTIYSKLSSFVQTERFLHSHFYLFFPFDARSSYSIQSSSFVEPRHGTF